MFKNLFHSKKKEAHPTAGERCSFLRQDCIKKRCLFWVDGFEKTDCLNQKEAFAAALALRTIRASRGSLLESFNTPQFDPLKRLLISMDPRDGLLFFESLLPEERVELVHSIAGMDFKNSREKTMSLANIFQMAAAMKKESFEIFMKAMKERSLILFQLFQRMDWWDYEDLQFLDDKGMNRWLREITDEGLWLALKLCGKNVKERINSLITENAVERIKTLDKERGNPSKREIKKAHRYILRLIIVFSETGEIEPPLKSYPRHLDQPEKTSPVSGSPETQEWILECHEESPEGAEAICPLLNSACAKEKCLFWAGQSQSFPWMADAGCLVGAFNGFFFSEKDEPIKKAEEKLNVPVLADWLIHGNREEMELVFAAMREEVQFETLFWILSTIYPRYLESNPKKKQFFPEIPLLLTSVSEILQSLPFKRRESILNRIRLRDVHIYKDMEVYGWHSFDELAGLSDKATQCWLREVNAEDLLLSMKLCGDKVKDKIFNNMSDRAAAMLAEDLSMMGPVRMSDVKKSQKAILKVVRTFMLEKKIKGWK